MANAILFDGVLTCALSVSDLDKSIAWYGDRLGFELMYKLDEVGWCELTSPVTNVTVGLSQVESVEGKGGATLTFGVKDIEAARKQLEAKDVRFDGEIETIPEMVRYATFFDPDGNTLMLAQDLTKK